MHVEWMLNTYELWPISDRRHKRAARRPRSCAAPAPPARPPTASPAADRRRCRWRWAPGWPAGAGHCSGWCCWSSRTRSRIWPLCRRPLRWGNAVHWHCVSGVGHAAGSGGVSWAATVRHVPHDVLGMWAWGMWAMWRAETRHVASVSSWAAVRPADVVHPQQRHHAPAPLPGYSRLGPWAMWACHRLSSTAYWCNCCSCIFPAHTESACRHAPNWPPLPVPHSRAAQRAARRASCYLLPAASASAAPLVLLSLIDSNDQQSLDSCCGINRENMPQWKLVKQLLDLNPPWLGFLRRLLLSALPLLCRCCANINSLAHARTLTQQADSHTHAHTHERTN